MRNEFRLGVVFGLELKWAGGRPEARKEKPMNTLPQRLWTRVGSLVATVLLAAAIPAWSQQPVRFRDLCDQYFDEGKGHDIARLIGFEVPAAKVTALKYRVLLYEAQPDGKAVEKVVDPKTYAFKVGDRIRLSVEPYTQSFIYIYHVGASKKQVFLYPRKGAEPKPVESGAAVTLPADGFFEFVKPPGEERLLVVATDKPISDLKLLGSVLSKFNDPNAVYTPEEQEVKNRLNATVEANLKSYQEKQIEKRDQVVRFRDLGKPDEQKQLTEDVKARQPKSATLELPKEGDGTLAVCLVMDKAAADGPTSFLVTIPLTSADGSGIGVAK